MKPTAAVQTGPLCALSHRPKLGLVLLEPELSCWGWQGPRERGNSVLLPMPPDLLRSWEVAAGDNNTVA